MAPRSQTLLRLTLLGGFSAVPDAARPMPVLTRKTQALLAYLALVNGKPSPREELAGMLWALQGEERARNNLRQSLSAIRAALGPAAARLAPVGRDAVALDPDAVAVDAIVFARCASDPAALRSAVDLYRGELLAGFETLAAPGFQAWRQTEAARLKSLAVFAFLQLLRQSEPESPGTEAMARRLLEIDPLQEPAHRALMRYYVGIAQPSLALDQYQRCRALLQRHLGTAPSAETEALLLTISDVGTPSEGPVRDCPPSILVLPFADLGGDADHDDFGLGLAEEITHALARVRWFLVLARSSDLVGTTGSTDPESIGRMRGARYVLTGTVRRAGARRRVTGRLLDLASGRHIWSDRFEGTAEDVFALQDAVTRAVVTAIEPSIERAEMDRAQRSPSGQPELYTLLFRAVSLRAAMTRDGSAAALGLLQRVLARDTGFVPAQAHLLLCHTQRATQGWDEPGEIQAGIRLARAAFAMHGDDPLILECVSLALLTLALDSEGALEAANRALVLHPNSSWIHNAAGWANIHVGKAEAATWHLAEAIRLNPFDPEGVYTQAGLGLAHLLAGRADNGLLWARRALRQRPELAAGHRVVIAALVELGHHAEAAEAGHAFMRIAPDAARVMAEELRQSYRNPAHAEMLIRARRSAGLPE